MATADMLNLKLLSHVLLNFAQIRGISLQLCGLFSFSLMFLPRLTSAWFAHTCRFASGLCQMDISNACEMRENLPKDEWSKLGSLVGCLS